MSLNTTVHRDAFWLLCDDEIGRGQSRVVYDSAVLKDCVIKVEDNVAKFANVLEWEVWQAIKETQLAKWFAPCEYISPSGIILVMKKTTTLAWDKYPEKVPAFFTDLKYVNYGMYNGHFVCHDYGNNLLMENGMTKRMRKADWWSNK